MLQVGIRRDLIVLKSTDFGIYLYGEDDEQDTVLLPMKEVPEATGKGDVLNVFIYRDSSDRLISTTRDPLIHKGELAVLKVVATTKIGAFLDWGLEKDLFLPFKEQKGKVKDGDMLLVSLYPDKTDRLCATMDIYNYLLTENDYDIDDVVKGRLYDYNEDFGAFVAIDDKFHGLIPTKDFYGTPKIGTPIEARVAQVREDGKLILSLRQKAHLEIPEDAKKIVEIMEDLGGSLNLHDKSDPELIKQQMHMSKRAFKRAVGSLLKAGRIELLEDGIKLLDKAD